MKAWLLGFGIAVLLATSWGAQDPTIVVQPATGADLLHIDPLRLDFGTIPIGTSSHAMAATLTNLGSATLKIIDITPSGIDFNESSTCSDTLAGGATCQIQVIFRPAISGIRLGVISVMTSASPNPTYIALNGVGQ